MEKRVKTGGRQKGTPNKVTQDLRELLKDFLVKEINQIHKELERVEYKDRLEFITKILPFALPRYEPVATPEANKTPSIFDKIGNGNPLDILDGSYRFKQSPETPQA